MMTQTDYSSKALLPIADIWREAIMPCELTLTLPAGLKTLAGRLVVYIHDPRELHSVRSFIFAVNRPLVLLCEQSVDLEMEMPEYVEAIDLDYSVVDSPAEECDPFAAGLRKCFILLNSLLGVLDPEGVVTVQSCHYQEQMIDEICRLRGLTSVILGQKVQSSVGERWLQLPASGDCEAVHQLARAVNDAIPLRALSQQVVAGLNLGCGRNVMSGWLNADLFSRSPQIMTMDASSPYPFPDESFDYIFSEHLFEHLDLAGQQNMLAECHRILRPGGVLRIATPNFDFLIDLVNNPDTDINKKYLDWSYQMFVHRKVDYAVDRKDYPVFVVNNFMHDWGHQFIHTPGSLTNLGLSCGFNKAERCSIGKSRHDDLNGCERHQNEIPTWANNLETFVMEFSKF